MPRGRVCRIRVNACLGDGSRPAWEADSPPVPTVGWRHAVPSILIVLPSLIFIAARSTLRRGRTQGGYNGHILLRTPEYRKILALMDGLPAPAVKGYGERLDSANGATSVRLPRS